MANIQRIETKEKLEHRIETGALKINDDWCGYFIRGDESLAIANEMEAIIYFLEGTLREKKEKMPFFLEVYVKNLRNGMMKEIYEDTLGGGIKTPLDLFTNAKKD